MYQAGRYRSFHCGSFGDLWFTQFSQVLMLCPVAGWPHAACQVRLPPRPS